MSGKWRRAASLCVGLLYAALIGSYFLSFVFVFLLAGFVGLIFWMALAPDLWRLMERGVQFLQEKVE